MVELSKLCVGCKMAGVYMGVVVFCDDILFLAPTRDGMQLMLDTCQAFAIKYNLRFSTNLTLKRARLSVYLSIASPGPNRSQLT